MANTAGNQHRFPRSSKAEREAAFADMRGEGIGVLLGNEKLIRAAASITGEMPINQYLAQHRHLRFSA